MKFGKLLLIGGLLFFFSQTIEAQAPQRFRQNKMEQRFDHQPNRGGKQFKQDQCRKRRGKAHKRNMRKRHMRQHRRG